jgi:hypothetical protein
VQIVTSVQLGIGWVFAAIVAASHALQFTMVIMVLHIHEFQEELPDMLYGVGWLAIFFALLMPVVAVHHFPLAPDNPRVTRLHQKKRSWLAAFLWLLRVDLLLTIASFVR